MSFTIKTLTLYRDLWYTNEKMENTVKTEFLWKYRCGNKNLELNPKKELYLLDGIFMGYSINKTENDNTEKCVAITQGKYLFLQGLIKNNEDETKTLLLDASEELYLESLWSEKAIINDVVFVRFLEEDGKKVFQLFREIKNT